MTTTHAYFPNENGRTDKTFVGIPTEAWGVSNNVRPSMRPPRFAEAVFQIQDESPLRMEVKVSQ